MLIVLAGNTSAQQSPADRQIRFRAVRDCHADPLQKSGAEHEDGVDRYAPISEVTLS